MDREIIQCPWLRKRWTWILTKTYYAYQRSVDVHTYSYVRTIPCRRTNTYMNNDEQIQTWIMGSFRLWHHTVRTEVYRRFERTRCVYKLYAKDGIITFHLKRRYVSTRMDGVMSQDSILHSQCCGNMKSC